MSRTQMWCTRKMMKRMRRRRIKRRIKEGGEK